jgi:hypothetical protein
MSFAGIEWVAVAAGTAGTVLWAQGRNQLAVSALWLTSSVLWVVFARINGHAGLAVRDTFGIVTAFWGMRTYWNAKFSSPESEGEFSLGTARHDCGVCADSACRRRVLPDARAAGSELPKQVQPDANDAETMQARRGRFIA